MLTTSTAKDYILSDLSKLFLPASFPESTEDADQGSKEKIGNRYYLTCDGMTKTISEWAEYIGINRHTLYARLRRGWSVADALFMPVGKSSMRTAKQFFRAMLAS